VLSIEITPVITAVVSVATVAATYWFTKQREREAELRKEKLEHYKEFATSLSGVVSGESTPDAQRAFALSCNRLMLVAPQSVIEALGIFQEEIKISNTARSNERHNELMSRLFHEMRCDLGISSASDIGSFRVWLWASGYPPTSPKKS
jgi:hypothetical protein